MIASGRLGRKTGAGWYEYSDNGRPRAAETPVAAGAGDGRTVLVIGRLPIADELRARLAAAGFAVVADEASGPEPWLSVICGETTPGLPGPRARLLADTSLHAADPRAAGFHVLPPLADAGLI